LHPEAEARGVAAALFFYERPTELGPALWPEEPLGKWRNGHHALAVAFLPMCLQSIILPLP